MLKVALWTTVGVHLLWMVLGVPMGVFFGTFRQLWIHFSVSSGTRGPKKGRWRLMRRRLGGIKKVLVHAAAAVEASRWGSWVMTGRLPSIWHLLQGAQKVKFWVETPIRAQA